MKESMRALRGTLIWGPLQLLPLCIQNLKKKKDYCHLLDHIFNWNSLGSRFSTPSPGRAVVGSAEIHPYDSHT